MRTAAVTRHGRRSTAAIGALSVSLAMAACGRGGEEAGSTQSAAGVKKAGGFDYYCAFHPFVRAKIRVVK